MKDFTSSQTISASPAAKVGEHLFGDQRPFAQCHASSLVELPGHRFLVAYFGGTHEGHRDVGIWLSEGEPGHWQAPRLTARINNQPHWNPVLFRSPTGPLLLWFKVGPSPGAWRNWCMRSDDNGATWSTPVELHPEDRVARGPVRCKPIVLHDGTVLAPNSDERIGINRWVWRACVDRSDDGGFSFQPGSLLSLDTDKITGHGVIQPTLWESSPGRIHMLLRSACGRVCRSDSDDNGHTWSPVVPTGLPNNNKGIDVVRLPAGRLALMCNPVSRTPEHSDNPQTPLSILFSDDNGATWPERVDIEIAPGQYIYPALILCRDGRLATTYTWNRTTISFWSEG